MKTRSYIILKFNEDGSIEGYVENSFSMGFSSSRVRVNRSFEFDYQAKVEKISKSTAASRDMRRDVDRLNNKFPKSTFRYFRVGAKNCPVVIDWNEIVNNRAKKEKIGKYESRNLPFSLKSL